MNYFFRALSLFLALFLLKSCGETTEPVPFSPAQTELLLGGSKMKSWKKISTTIQETGQVITCTDTVIWTFHPKIDTLFVANEIKSCDVDAEIMQAKYSIRLSGSNTFLKFEPYLRSRYDTIRGDSVIRKIIMINEREFTAELQNSSPLILEKFEAQ